MKKYIKIAILILTVALNIIAWLSKGFCDWYIDNVFNVTVNTWARVNSVFPFSVGEVMIILGIIFLILTLIIGGMTPILYKKKKSFFRIYFDLFTWVLVIIALIMTSNCFVLYHASTFEEIYFEDRVDKEYTQKELNELYKYVATKLNELGAEMERDENGYIIYEDNISDKAILAMQNIGTTYARFDGYYPRAKKIKFSKFMSQQYLAGVYFPFSMEANYNKEMYIANNPFVICHELSHLKGTIYEDEANFIGYLACINSDDKFFQYSGYLSVLYYIESAMVHPCDDVDVELYVYLDDIFLKQETWEEVEEEAIFDTETVDVISDAFTETNLQLNGIEEGVISYSKVVDLLLKYYDGVLY